MIDLTPSELNFALRNLNLLDPNQKAQVLGLLEEREKARLDFPIIVKPTVHKLNFRLLPKIVEWVKSLTW